MMNLESIFAQVKLGRGLWVGMFPEFSEDFVENRARILGCNHDSFTETPEHAHITLAHFGRSPSYSTIERVHAAMEMAASLQLGDLRSDMTGVLRFKRHMTIALVPDEIIMIRHKLRTCLSDRGVTLDKRFSMTPHITIGKLAYESEQPRCPALIEKALTFRALRLVCGDAHMSVAFTAGVF